MSKLTFENNPEAFEVASFTIPTALGPVSFDLAIPKHRYDGLKLFELFQKYHGPSPAQIQAASPSKAEEALAFIKSSRQNASTTKTRRNKQT